MNGGGRVARVLLCGALAVVSGRALACKCVDFGPPAQYIARVDAVFVGVVEDVHAAGDGLRAQIRPERLMRGSLSVDDRGRVVVRSGSGNCRTAFAPGEKYLVLAKNDGTEGGLWTDLCDGTAPLSQVPEPMWQALGGHPREFDLRSFVFGMCAGVAAIGTAWIAVRAFARLRRTRSSGGLSGPSVPGP